MAGSGWVPPEKLPHPTGWRRWPIPVVAGLLTIGVLLAVADGYEFDPLNIDQVPLFGLSAWTLGSVVTARVARARTIADWALAFALMAGVLLAFLVVEAVVILRLLRAL